MPGTIRRVVALVGGVTIGLALHASVAAQDAVGATSDVGGGVSTFGLGDWLGLALRLGIVLIVIWVSVMAMRWYVRRTQGIGGRGGAAALEILETHVLGPNRALHLVRLGDRAVLVGATPERITSLMTVDDAEEVSRLTDRPDATERRSLAASLRGSMSAAPSASRASLAGDEAPRHASLTEIVRLGLSALGGMLPSLPGRPRLTPALDADLDRELAEAVPTAHATSERTRGRLGRAASMLRRDRRADLGQIDDQRDEVSARPRLFERTLAAAEQASSGVEDDEHVAGELNASRAMRARSGYGLTTVATTSAGSTGRERRIAEIQQAIVRAQRNAG